MASSGTSKLSHVLVRPARISIERLLGEVQRDGGRVGLEVGTRPVALEGVAPLRDLPFERHRTLGRGLRQVDLHAVPGGLDVADVDQPGQRRRPQPGERSAAGVEREVVLAVVPARRHDPAVLVVEVALLRPRVGVLVPRVTPVDRVAERVVAHEHLLVGPVVVVRAAEQDPDAEVDVDEAVGDELAVDDNAWGDEHLASPPLHVAVGEVAHLRVLEGAPAAEQGASQADLLVARAARRRRSRRGRRASARPSS